MTGFAQCVVAPGGFQNLDRDRSYFVVGRRDPNSFINLCFFSTKPPNVYLERLTADDFDRGIEEAKIQLVDSPPYPPWVAPFASPDIHRNSTATSLAQFLEANKGLVDERYETIKPLVLKMRKILGSSNPFKEINKHAKNHEPELNQGKTRLHFFAYLCFGLDETALLPNTWKNGRWIRDKTNRFDDDLCIVGYLKHKKIGKPYAEIYIDVLRDQFKCRSRDVDGKMETYQPEGKPYPTKSEFMTVLKNKFGQERLDENRYGKNRARKKNRQSDGTFTEFCSNLMERIEADVYYVRAVHKGVTADEMPPMCVARLICSTSGKRLGIGASLNGEKASAYATAFFSMGLPKAEFCNLFGLDIDRARWPSVGLPISLILDRGAGTQADLLTQIQEYVPHIEMAPSHSGQSKAIVESTHPRNTRIDGHPVFEISDLNYHEYFKREIVKTIESNWTSDVSGRENPELKNAQIPLRPIHIWNYLSSYSRIDSVTVSKERLIRSLLRKKTCRINRSGARLSGLCFRSDALAASGLCERLPGNRSFEMDVYVLDLCLRQIWLDFNGRLIEVYMVPPTQTGDDDVNWTIKDLERMNKIQRRLQREAEQEDVAMKIAMADLYKEQTGFEINAGRQTHRRPKRRTQQAMDELAVLHKMFGTRK